MAMLQKGYLFGRNEPNTEAEAGKFIGDIIKLTTILPTAKYLIIYRKNLWLATVEIKDF